MAQIIDGKALATTLRAKLAKEVADMIGAGVKPGLAVIIVGEDPASQIYVRSKTAQAIEIGMGSFAHRLSNDTSEEELLALIANLNRDDEIDGILVQLPLPAHIDPERILSEIDPRKDVDGFHPVNVGHLTIGGESVIPCTPLGSLLILKSVHTKLEGLNAVIIGRSNIVGKPMAQLLLRENCTVTIAHSSTRDLPKLARSADILVVGVGRPEMIRGSWIKSGATVIDIGINRIKGTKRLVGDVAFSEAVERAGAITPVPGGVGPMTIACLLRNTVESARSRLD